MKKIAVYSTFLLSALLALSLGIWFALKPSALLTVQGEQIHWQSEQGQWKIVNFYAQWCSPCLREIPALNTLATGLPDTIRILGVSYDPATKAQLEAQIATLDIRYDVLIVDENTVFPMPYPAYLPATYIVNPEGEAVASLFGEQSVESLQHALAELGQSAL